MRTAATLALAMLLVGVGTTLAWADVHQAASEGDLEQVRELLDEGADPNDIPEEQFGALHWAALRGHVEVATLLLDSGADINRRAIGVTPLSLATESGHREMIELLVARGADIEAGDASGGTPLHT
ncbi:MAG: ankyrin repeat domain-containing protein, partial [Armatimonadota bacterium]